MLTLLLACVFGLVQGLRHAFEPDHIVALSTMIGETRDSRGRVLYAACWGAGHGLVLLVVGAVLLAARRMMPERMTLAFEAAVGVMLIALGVRALLLVVARQSARAAEPHRHPSSGYVRPLAIGIVHGLAGSGALTALALSQLPTVAGALAFVALFGVGATAAMALLAGAVGSPLGRLMRSPRGLRAFLLTTGVLSMALGAASLAAAVLHA